MHQPKLIKSRRSKARFGWFALALFLFVFTSPLSAQEIGTRSTRRLYCMGQSWKVPVYSTSEQGLVMLRADHEVLFKVARALGQSVQWSDSNNTLVGPGGDSVSIGQKELTIHGTEETLALPPRFIGDDVYIPSSALEGLLECRVTVKNGKKGAIYVEPILKSATFNQNKELSTELELRTSVPMRKNVFELKKPSRTVIDLVGIALPYGTTHIEHPVLGPIRVGQFKLAPSITRIVLPTENGMRVKKQRTFDLFEHKLTISWPQGTQRIANNTPEKTSASVKRPNRHHDTSASKVIKIKGQQTTVTESAARSNHTILENLAWEGNRLKLQFSKPVPYRWSRVNTGKKRFLVDFPGVVYPQKKRYLKSSIPGLQSVRVVQNTPEPQPIVRLVCDLKSNVVVETKPKDEKVLYLSFPGRQVASSDYPKGRGHTSSKHLGTPKGRTICLDAGHGGSDPGALNRREGINEKTVTLDITLKLAKLLRAQGWNVILTRSSDRDVSWAGSSGKQELGARARVANDFGADLFVSIHANASVKPSINGTSIHWYKSSDYRLARLMESGVMSATGRKNRGLIKNRFYVLAHTEMPAVLVETAFLTNSTEGSMLADPWYRKKIARGIAAGLQVYASRTFTTRSAQK